MNQSFEADTQHLSSHPQSFGNNSPPSAGSALEKLRHTLLQGGRQLTTLDLSRHNLTSADFATIAPLLRKEFCPGLIKLNLSNNLLGDSMPIIADILLNNRTIADLNLSGIGLSELGCQQLQKATGSDVIRLGRIVLSNNPILDSGLDAVIKSINFRCDPALEYPTIECDQCNLSDEAFYALETITERYDHVRVIFTGNKFSSNGKEPIICAIGHYRHIKHLNLRDNSYSDEAAVKILSAALSFKLNFLSINNIRLSLPTNIDYNLLKNIPQYYVRFTNMKISPELIGALSEEIQSKSQIHWEFKRLSFEKCLLDLTAIIALSGLASKKSIYTLSFIECIFPSDETWIASLFAQKFACTRQLILDVCKIDDDLLEILSSKLKNIPGLHTVSLKSNLLTPRSIKRLEQWLGREKKCDELILSGNLFDPQGFSMNLLSPKKIDNPHPMTPDPNASPPSEIEQTQSDLVLHSPRFFLERSTSPPSLKKLLTPRFRGRSTSVIEEEKAAKESPKKGLDFL